MFIINTSSGDSSFELPVAFNNQLSIDFNNDGSPKEDVFDNLNSFSTSNDYYVNYAEGDNSNLGTSTGVGNSWKTFDYAVSNAVSPATIHVEDDLLGYLSSGLNEKVFAGDFKIIGEGNWLGRGRTLVAGMRETYTQASFAWSAVGGTGAWECTNVQAKQYRAQFDPRTIDIDGFPLPITTAVDRATCEATEGTYHWTSGTLTVHLAGGVEPDPLVNWVYAESAYDFEIHNSASSGKVTVQNCEFLSNLGTSVKAGFRYRPVTTGVANTQQVGLKNCYVYGTSGPGFQIYECEIFVLQDCNSKFTRSDGGNYHTFGIDGSWMTGYEVNCNFKEVGFDDFEDQPALGTSNNGSSAHDNIHLARSGCAYDTTEGAVIADVGGAVTVSMDCHPVNPTGGASPNALFWADSAGGDTTEMYLYKCSGVTDVGELTISNTISSNVYVEDFVGTLLEVNTVGDIKNFDGSPYVF